MLILLNEERYLCPFFVIQLDESRDRRCSQASLNGCQRVTDVEALKAAYVKLTVTIDKL